MNEQKFVEYAKLKIKAKQISDRLKELEDGMVSEIVSSGNTQFEIPHGLFSIRTTKSWKYSENVEKLSDELKKTKEAEEESGIAISEEKQGIMFKPNKIK